MQSLVSILLPCYNAENYLHYSIQSILKQDYKNLEIICINDGSSDATLNILNEYKNKDSRIVIINNETNIGLINSLNKALKLVKGDYFARMDADDYSTPDRISTQLKFIKLNPEIDVVSSAYNYFKHDEQKEKYIAPIAKSANALKFLSLFCTPLTHASVLGKTSLINSGLFVYDINYPYAEDFELFSRLAWKNVKIANQPISLYWVRLHSSSVSVLYNHVQFDTNLKITDRNIKNYLNDYQYVSPSVLGLLSCRVPANIEFKELKQSFYFLDKYLKDFSSSLAKNELAEVNEYLLLHKLNIIIQANKVRFKTKGYFENGVFSLKSLFLLNLKQFFLLIKKLIYVS